MPKRRSPAPRAPKVPARFRALGGVDPRKLPPGTPYPCGDALVGQRARGKRLAGVVQSCAVPPAGSRGPHYALGNVVSGSEIGRAWRSSAREAEALDARYSGPDFDLRRKRASKARPAAPSPAPAAPEGLEIVRGFDELSRRWGLLPSSANTQKWLAGLMVIDGDLHVYGDALVAMGVAAALGNLYPSSTIRGVFVSAFNDAVRAANLAQMGQDDRTPVVVDVKPIPAVYDAATRGQPVTRSVRLSFTSHGKNGEHFDVRAAQGARLTRAVELAAPLPKGGIARPAVAPAAKRRGEFLPDGTRVYRSVRELDSAHLMIDAASDRPSVEEINAMLRGSVLVFDANEETKAARERLAVSPYKLPVIYLYGSALVALNMASVLRSLPISSEVARSLVAIFEPVARRMAGSPAVQSVTVPGLWDGYEKPADARLSLRRRDDGGIDVTASAVARREELPLPLPKGGLRRPELPAPLPEGGLPRPKARAAEGYSLNAVQEVVRSFFATGPIAPDAITVLDRAINALMLPPRAGDPDSIAWTLRDPSTEVPVIVYTARNNALTKRRAVRDGAATRTTRAAKTREQKNAAAALMDLIEGTTQRLRTLSIALPVGVFPSDSDSGEKAAPTKRAAPTRAVSATPAKRREELPLPLPKGGLRRPELPAPLPEGGLPRPRPVPRRSTVVRREELPLPVPPSFLKDPPPTEASMPVGEAMEAVAEASADGTNWSKYQSAIFKFITLGTGNAVVEAVAGSGKSTTIVEAVKRIPRNKSVLVLAFNRTVRDELKEKFTGFTNVTVRTLSGHGWVTMAQAWKPIVQAQGERDMWYQGEARFRQILDAAGVPPPVLYWDRLHREAARRDAEPAHVRLVQWLKKNSYDEGKYEREVMTWNRHYESLKKLIELCRGFMALTPAAIQDVQREYGLLLTMPRRRGDGANAAPRPWTWFDPRTNTTYDTDTVIRWVQAALKASLIRPVDGKVAMFDATFPTAMLDYFAPQQFDWIFVDETQDMDTSQLIVVQKSVAPGGRVVVVGDSKQAIYAFRGADSRAMARMEQALNAVRLPLSVSYRVPKCVEAMVKPVVPAFEVPPGTPEGVCKTVTARHMIREWRDGDFVISRKNAPLEPLAIMAIQQGKSVIAVGLADIQKVLRDVVNGAMKFNPTNGDEFRDAIEKYRARQRANIEEIERRKRARSFSRMKDHEVEAFIEDLPVVRTLDLAANAVEAMSKRVNGSAEIDKIIASVNYSAGRDQIVPASALKGKLAFTSVHKIKGAESPRVWVLNDTFNFQGKVDATGKPIIKQSEEMTDNARQEEINLWYVAVTRAKNTRGGPPGELYLVTGLKDVLGDAYVDDDEEEGKAKDA